LLQSTASPDVNTGSLKLNDVGPSVSTASPNEEDSTKEEPEVYLRNITNYYIVPTTPNTRIHKDHPIDNVIGEVQSTVQTRKMSKPTSEQGFLRSGYHQKDRKPSQNDKTEHGMEKTVQNQGQSPKMPKSESILKNQQSNRSRN
ncbi:hypothetical protein Tco_1547697, partial [Tanacetum coccineum]